MSKVVLSSDDIKKIAKLANLPLQEGETDKFATQFTQTIKVVNELSEIDTSEISPTYQVNNLQNITREDIVDESRVLSQDLAIREAKKTHNGYIVVDRIIDNS
jgi:aspartyl-tRNA(Asn)/glutamyl-tRNA(Gln) amidotransferase subunit C